MQSRQIKTLRADLTDEQWYEITSLVTKYEKTNLLNRSVDVSPSGDDSDGGRVWHVWVEGYSATGEHGTASFVGKKWARSFDRACELLHKENGGDRTQGQFLHATETSPPTMWGCRMYDNERDARVSYG